MTGKTCGPTFWTTALVVCSMLVAIAAPALSQGASRAGASATIRVGEVVGLQQIKLKDNSAKKGALIGGAIGLALGSGKNRKSSQKRAVVGTAAGAIAGSAKQNPAGMQYNVRTGDNTILSVVTDQREIRLGDCVDVEQSGGSANIRRMPYTACQPASKAVLEDPAIKQEMQHEAAECLEAKEQVLAAETETEVNVAVAKMSIFCDD